MNDVVINYTLELSAGWIQTLNDGTNSYLYGNGRISQTGSVTKYFLGDALGSVRQLTDASGEVTLAKSYDPYGTVTLSSGNGTSPFAYTGEQMDASGLTYLRARYYSSGDGRFLSRDTWGGDYNRPLSLNRWGYVEGNPVNFVDPTGLIREKEADNAGKIVRELRIYNVFVKVDWGFLSKSVGYRQGYVIPECVWQLGDWNLNELKELRKGVVDLSRSMGGLNKFTHNVGYVKAYKEKIDSVAKGGKNFIKVNNLSHNLSRWTVVHELAHSWDANYGWQLSVALEIATGGHTGYLNIQNACDNGRAKPGCNSSFYYYGGTPAKGSDINFNRKEDFAESVAAYVYPNIAESAVAKFNRPSTLYLYYPDYESTERWSFVYAIIQSARVNR